MQRNPGFCGKCVRFRESEICEFARDDAPSRIREDLTVTTLPLTAAGGSGGDDGGDGNGNGRDRNRRNSADSSTTTSTDSSTDDEHEDNTAQDSHTRAPSL